MSKRGKMSGGSVTGGTGDIKPQLLTAQATQPAVNQYGITNINLPVPRFGGNRSKATIFEILKVFFYFGIADDADLLHVQFMHLATTDLGRASGDTSSGATLLADLDQTNVIASGIKQFVTTTSGGGFTKTPLVMDVTDNNGNGVLVGTDKMVLLIGSSSGTTLIGGVVKILYRQVNVGVQEYVGIVQSQLQ